MTFRGSATDLNNALANLTYQGSLHYNGPDTININVDDLGNNGQGNTLQDSGTIAVNVTAVNNAPTLTLPVGQSVAEDTVLSLPAITVSDVDAAGDPLEVTLSAANGTLSLGDTTNLTFSVGDGSENATMTFRGSATDLNNALANLTYQGSLHYNGPDTININVDDLGNNGQGNTLQDSGTIAVNVLAVNDRPTSSGITDVSVEEDSTNTIINLYSVFDDVEDADSQLTYQIVQNTNPALFQTAAINPLTGRLVLRYDANMNGSSTLTVMAQDTEGLIVTESFEVEVTPVNDVPDTKRDFYSVRGDEILDVAADGVLGNDTDIDEDALSAVLVQHSMANWFCCLTERFGISPIPASLATIPSPMSRQMDQISRHPR